MYAIETHGLSKAFNGMYAVDNLDLHVPEGAIYGFIGENEAADAQTFTNAWRVLEMVQGGAVGMDLMALAHFGGLRGGCAQGAEEALYGMATGARGAARPGLRGAARERGRAARRRCDRRPTGVVRGHSASGVPPPEGRLCVALGEPRGGRGACEGTQGQRDWTALHDGPLLRNRSCGGGPMATSDPSSQACGLALITLQST